MRIQLFPCTVYAQYVIHIITRIGTFMCSHMYLLYTYIILHSWRFLLLTPVLNFISCCCCNGFALIVIVIALSFHSPRTSSSSPSTSMIYVLFTFSSFQTNIYIYIRVHTYYIYDTCTYVYTVCGRPIVSRYNGDVCHRELNGRRISRSFYEQEYL